jgi:hypothetical protein
MISSTLKKTYNQTKESYEKVKMCKKLSKEGLTAYQMLEISNKIDPKFNKKIT